MKKKLLLLFICTFFLIGLTACGGSGSNNTDTSGEEAPEQWEVLEKEMSIDDFDWDVKRTSLYGTRCYLLSLVNNSEYELLGVQMDYGYKDDVTDKQRSVFRPFMKEHKDWINDDLGISDVKLRGYRNEYIPVGGSVDKVPILIGIDEYTWQDIPNKKQFNLMEPSELQVIVVGKEKELIAMSYDFYDKSWTSGETIEYNTWSYIDDEGRVPKPKNCYYVVKNEYENINTFNVDVYKTNKNKYNKYVKRLKKRGFSRNELTSSGYYSAENKRGDKVIVNYKDHNKTFSISVDLIEDEDE